MEKDKIIYELENKIKELEEKHYNECRQISEYQEENRKLKEELEVLRQPKRPKKSEYNNSQIKHKTSESVKFENNAENSLRQHIMNRFMDVK